MQCYRFARIDDEENILRITVKIINRLHVTAKSFLIEENSETIREYLIKLDRKDLVICCLTEKGVILTDGNFLYYYLDDGTNYRLNFKYEYHDVSYFGGSNSIIFLFTKNKITKFDLDKNEIIKYYEDENEYTTFRFDGNYFHMIGSKVIDTNLEKINVEVWDFHIFGEYIFYPYFDLILHLPSKKVIKVDDHGLIDPNFLVVGNKMFLYEYDRILNLDPETRTFIEKTSHPVAIDNRKNLGGELNYGHAKFMSYTSESKIFNENRFFQLCRESTDILNVLFNSYRLVRDTYYVIKAKKLPRETVYEIVRSYHPELTIRLCYHLLNKIDEGKMMSRDKFITSLIK